MPAETSPPTFSIGVTYWPRRAGFLWWRAFDRGAVREELAHVAALGCDTVRFCLSWEEFQPSPQRVTGAQAAHVVEICEAISTSAREGHPIDIRSNFVPPTPLDWAE
ncbi:hypothetical protein SE17_11950 [Kouleothrix aurantiaca]|uniref:Uncharacterized protein n=1 Tax=Kouleothrix aurantiaca TaxID=186479 RepID=A0A0P9D247_9CHLR|nr:hypothetical protein SE17_11950 [Kouleothrix aurantiaca]